ncbi:MAG: DNRLRE domain-containing protein [Polyangiaceae bacterium]|nr:DNRLRE domain-containing protein [Polyangiaceae bacterium]
MKTKIALITSLSLGALCTLGCEGNNPNNGVPPAAEEKLLGQAVQASGAAQPNTVLMLYRSQAGGIAPEMSTLQAAGYNVELATPAQWTAKTQADFATYRALIFPDWPWGEQANLNTAAANAAVWSPVVNGNILIAGADPSDHPPGGTSMTVGAVLFAAEEPGKTGLYLCLSDFYDTSPAGTPIPVLSGLGSFTLRGASCYDNAHKVAEHPVLAGLTDTTLSNWACSVHETFDTYPSDYLPLAIAKNITGPGMKTFPDGSFGIPYVLAKGASLAPINCGNNQINAGEECDDGNQFNNDGCSAQCQLEENDGDGDQVGDGSDNCPNEINPDQADSDNDGVGDACDNCLNIANPNQENSDGDDVGSACDNCPFATNQDQADGDGDGKGNACDNCAAVTNPGQEDTDLDTVGNACDNCVDKPNSTQVDGDGDGKGNACDNCPNLANADQVDADTDSRGDACDNCLGLGNLSQLDTNGDGLGDACDLTCVTVRRGSTGAVEDASISSLFPGQNAGAATEIAAGQLNGTSSALLKFDLTGLPPMAQVVSAQLALFSGSCCGPTDVEIHKATAAWSEATVTSSSFNNAVDSTVLATLSTCQAPSLADLTAVAAQWKADASQNFGVVLTQTGNVATVFQSSETSNLTDRPALRVCYTVSECAAGTAECDLNAQNGCETNTLASADNCGGCGVTCSYTNAGAACDNGSCSLGACDSGAANCNQNPIDGCEAVLASNTANCGSCGYACENLHGTTACTSGACNPACETGYGSCDGNEQNGCETPLTSLTNCGACGTPCDLPNANETCGSGVCSVASCAANFGNCNNNPSDGCEVPLTTLTDCGSCGSVCNLANASESCQTGKCQIAACDQNFANCDLVPQNGCETNLLTTTDHCGACGNKCVAINGTNSCVNSACAPQCAPFFGDCDIYRENGCETPIYTTDNCGACGVVCSFPNATPVCDLTVCKITACHPGFANCDGQVPNGCETPITTVQNCGACGNSCNVNGGHASGVACVQQTCVIEACEPGYGDCDSSPANGCEVDLLANVQNCGGCGIACSNGHGTTTCNAGSCVPTCAEGYTDCDGNPTNGCETNTKATCGQCVSGGVSCRDIRSKDATAASGVYMIDEDGNGPIAARSVYCDMTTDGGGWTAVFVGKNGRINVFDRFDTGYYSGVYSDAERRYLQRKPAWSPGGEMAVQCGTAMVKFPTTFATENYFANGGTTPLQWNPITPTVIAGTVTNPPNTVSFGINAGEGFAFARNQSGRLVFGSSSMSNVLDRCNTVIDNTSTLRVFYREPPPNSCAAGTADCDNDPTNGCETITTYATGGACGVSGQSCRAILTANPTAPSGVYTIDRDGGGPEKPLTAYCDMSTDGGGWTAFFVGKNGPLNVFDHFEAPLHVGVSKSATGKYLVRAPQFTSLTGLELAVSCGPAMVKYPWTTQMRDLFTRGVPINTHNLPAGTAIAGTVVAVPNMILGGGVTGQDSFIFTQNGSTTLMFASSSTWVAFNRCNGVVDSTSTVRLYYREPPASACTSGTADCNGDPTDGCETNVALSGGLCTPMGKTCREVQSTYPSAPSGNYVLDPDGSGPVAALAAYCDMTTDGGGWTAMFTGKNGAPNYFDRFDTTAYQGIYKNPNDKYLQRKIKYGATTGVELGVSCGAAMVKFPMNAAAEKFFSAGTQSSWVQLPGGTTVTGTVTQMPNYLFTGNALNVSGFIFAKDQNPNLTFASSQSNTQYNFCNSVANTTSTVRVFFREPAVNCPAGFSNCDGDPTNGCEVNDEYTLGACQGETSCQAILRKHPGVPSGIYLVDADGSGGAPSIPVRCDMTTDGGGYTMVRFDEPALAADQTAYMAICQKLGMEMIVPRTKAHAQSIYTWNQNTPPNLVNVFPRASGVTTLKSFAGVCKGGSCPFWITDFATGKNCSTSEPSGDNHPAYSLLRTAAGCGIEGTWADSLNNVSIQDSVICSTNDKNVSVPPPPSGFGNCDGNGANGCEASLSSVANCGACGNTCSPQNGQPTCTSGVCGLSGCNTGFGNCDGSDLNGCETNLVTSVANCGSCGNTCTVSSGTPTCTGGECGMECGGSPCAAPANASPLCNANVCTFSCNTGFADCDGNALNGCEAFLSSPEHCGSCGQGCTFDNGNATCNAGSCTLSTCNAGYGNCDGDDLNGCELDLTSDNSNCGACGVICTTTCAAGTCAGPGCINPGGCAGNSAPTITSSPVTSGTEEVAWYYAALAKDTDGDTLTWTLLQAPAGMVVNANTGLVSWTPGPTAAGTYPIALRVADEGGATFTQAFGLTIAGVNNPPKIVSPPLLTGIAGSTYLYPAAAVDADSPSLTWSVTGPSGMTVSSAGLVEWSIPSGTAGNFPVTLEVSDGQVTATQTFSVGVSAAGDTTPPVVTITSPTDGSAITEKVNIVGTVSDAALSGYQVRACRHWAPGAPACETIATGTAPVTNGTLASFDPTLLANGTWDIEVEATDAAGNENTASVAIAVTGDVKLGVIRLELTDLVVRTTTAEIKINRVYDGLDLRKTELGHGFRFDWHVGHLERPEQMKEGWTSFVCGGFIPKICLGSGYDHPVKFYLPDGRTYEFLVEVEGDGGLTSIHPARPVYTEQSTYGATLETLNSAFVPYSTVDFDLYESGGVVYEDLDFNEWEPSYYELHTERGEVITFKTQTFEVVKIKDEQGVVIELSGGNIVVDGNPAVAVQTGPDGLIKKLTDTGTGRQVNYVHNAAGELIEVTTVDGFTQTYGYAAGHRLVSYQTTGEGSDSYFYDERGRLTKQTNADGAVIQFEYDEQGRTVTTTDVAGNSVVTEYDSLGRVTQVTDPLGHTNSMTYVGNSKNVATRTDALGHVESFEYDSRGRKTKVTNALGASVQVTYDSMSDRPLQIIDAAGRTYQETVDSSGRATAFIQPDGAVVRSFSYPNPTTTVVTDARGNTETYNFDSKARVTAYTNASGATWTSVFDDTLHTNTTTLPDGSTTHTQVDGMGRSKQVITTNGDEFNYGWKPDGSIDQVARPDGLIHKWNNSPGGKPSSVQLGGTELQHYGYDALGRLTLETGVGTFKAYEYDAAGRRTLMTTESGTIVYAYDAAGKVTSLQAQNGRSVTYEHDAAGQLTAVQDSSGRRREMSYDPTGRITSYLDELGRTLSVDWDENGRLHEVTYPDGRHIHWTFYPGDSLDFEEQLVASVSDIEGVAWAYDYNPEGKISEVTDALGNLTSYQYDTTGHITQVVDQLARVTSMTWSPDGITSMTTPDGSVQTWVYSPNGDVDWTRADGTTVSTLTSGETTTVTLPSGGVYTVHRDPSTGETMEQGAPAGAVTEVRNSRGTVDSFTTADGASVDVSYTPEGKIAGATAKAPGGATFTSSYSYDAAGRVTSMVDPAGETTTFAYDNVGRVTLISYANGTQIVYQYGLLHRPLSVEHKSGGVTVEAYTYAYDTHGRLTSETNPEGSFDYTYDALNHLTGITKTLPNAQVETVTRTFDAVGNKVSETSAAGTTTYTYDVNDRLVSTSGPNGTTTYQYNGRGALTSVAAPTGTTVYGYDDLDRLTSVTLPGGQVIAYKYDVTGRLLARNDGTGERRCLPMPARLDGFDDCALNYGAGGADPAAYSFGPAGLAGVHHGGNTFRPFTTDRGSVTGLTDGSGNSIATRSYDVDGAIASNTGTFFEHGYLGERQDVSTGLVYLRHRWYAPALGRFLTPDSASAAADDTRALHRYAYAGGDPINKVDRAGTVFSIAGVTVSLSISQTLAYVDRVARFCLGGKITKNLFKAVASYLTEKIADFVLGQFLGPRIPGLREGTEYKFQQIISWIVCGDVDVTDLGALLLPGDIEFEVEVDNCGKRVTRSGTNSAAAFTCNDDMRAEVGKNGVDIVIAGVFPVELKRTGAAIREEQTKRWCRFAYEQHAYVVLFVFKDFPSESKHAEEAGICWTCWNRSGCGRTGILGSVYIAVGLEQNSSGSRKFIPDLRGVCGQLQGKLTD